MSGSNEKNDNDDDGDTREEEEEERQIENQVEGCGGEGHEVCEAGDTEGDGHGRVVDESDEPLWQSRIRKSGRRRRLTVVNW